MLFVFLLVVAGCGGTQATSSSSTTAGFVVVNEDLPPDPEMDALVAPYREEMEAVTSQVIGTAAVAITEEKPESRLGNLAADALLRRARQLVDTPVDAAVTNYGGLRVDIGQGPITLRQIYEVMPFENRIVVLTFTGAEMDSLAQQIASINGEAIAGFSLAITPDDRATDVRIGGEPLDRNGTYRVATIDYLANGGGGLPALWTPQARTDSPVLFRDAIADHIRALTAEGTSIAPALEGRITRTP